MSPTQFSSLEAVKDAAGSDLGVSRWIEVTQARIDGFAQSTEDWNWMHVDSQAASVGPFGKTIAHGFLTLSLLAPLIDECLQVAGCSLVINYGLDRVRFPAVVPSGSRIRARLQIIEAHNISGGIQVSVHAVVESAEQSKPVCVADVLVRLMQ